MLFANLELHICLSQNKCLRINLQLKACGLNFECIQQFGQRFFACPVLYLYKHEPGSLNQPTYFSAYKLTHIFIFTTKETF